MTRLIVFLVLLTPANAQNNLPSRLAATVRDDVQALDSQPTLAAWQTAHPHSHARPAHYETQQDAYDVDFRRENRWCAASVLRVAPELLASALFYVPVASVNALPPLPAQQDKTLIQTCRLQGLWYETHASVSIEAVTAELVSSLGRPTGTTAKPDIGGWARWTKITAWHRPAADIWVAYDPFGRPGGAQVPRVIVYARRTTPPDPDSQFELLGPALQRRMMDQAAHLANQDAALTETMVNRSHCQAQPLKPETEASATARLTTWLAAAKPLPPDRRAAALLLTDADLACMPGGPSQRLIHAVGAGYAPVCPQDGPTYTHNFRRQAEYLDPQGRAGELAGLSSLADPCSLKGQLSWPDLEIAKAQEMLGKFPSDEWTPWLHYLLGRAHAVRLSLALPGGDPEGGNNTPLTLAGMEQQRQAAIEEFRQFLKALPHEEESVFAWQEAWRLLAGLPPSMIHFGCSCE